MSIENGVRGIDSESQRYVQELKDYLKDKDVGTVKFQAFSDFYNLQSLGRSRDKATEQKTENTDVERAIRHESSLRITEFRIALLEHEMEQKKMSIPGYGTALYKIFDLHETIADGVFQTAADEYPGDEKSIENYGDGLLERSLRSVNDSLVENRIVF